MEKITNQLTNPELQPKGSKSHAVAPGISKWAKAGVVAAAALALAGCGEKTAKSNSTSPQTPAATSESHGTTTIPLPVKQQPTNYTVVQDVCSTPSAAILESAAAVADKDPSGWFNDCEIVTAPATASAASPLATISLGHVVAGSSPSSTDVQNITSHTMSIQVYGDTYGQGFFEKTISGDPTAEASTKDGLKCVQHFELGTVMGDGQPLSFSGAQTNEFQVMCQTPGGQYDMVVAPDALTTIGQDTDVLMQKSTQLGAATAAFAAKAMGYIFEPASS